MSAPRAAFTDAQRARIVVVGGAIPLLLAFVGAALVFSWRDRLPGDVAIQWDGSGPSTFAPLGFVIALIVAIAVVLAGSFLFAALSLTDQASPSRGRSYIGAGVGATTALTIAVVFSIGAQRSAGVTDGVMVGRILLLGVAIGLVVGGAAWLATPRSVRAEPSAAIAPDPIELSPEERAVFSRNAAPGRRLFVVVGGLLGVLFALTIAVAIEDPGGWVAVAVVAVVAALVFSGLVWRVTITRVGVVARGALGLPRFTVPIDEIVSARVTRIDPLAQFGGWGVRPTGGGVGIILAPGDALDVTRVGGRRLTITVPDAATAAALVNGFVARARLP